MEKRGILNFIIILLLFGGLLIFLYLSQGKITGFSVYEQSTQLNFDEGTYNSANYNGSAVVLNSGQTSGNYTSKIFDTTGSSKWNNISWTSSAIGELPDNGATETNFGSGNLDMSGNVLLLHLNETSGTLADSSGNSNTGTNFGGTYGAAGRFDNAVGFDASAERIEVANSQSLNITKDITISLWVKPNVNTHSSWNYFAAHQSSLKYEFGVYNAGLNPRWKVYNSSGISTEVSAGTMNVGNWHNVVGVRSGTSVLLYLDGVQVASNTNFQGDLRAAAGGIIVGGDTGSRYFNGTLDEIAIWNRSLSAQEITGIYKRGATRLNLSVQSCDDSACSGESFSDIGDDSPQTLSVADNRYFQYRFNLKTDNSSYTPNLYNVKVDYTLNNAAPIWANLADNETSTTPKNNESIHINASLSDDINLSNYIFSWNDSGSWTNDSVVALSTNQTTVSANKTVTSNKNNAVSYRFYFNDSNGVNNQTDIGTFNVKNSLPIALSLDQPANSTATNDNTPFFNWSASSDADNDSITYRIQIDNNIDFISSENESTTTATNFTSSVLSDGTYYWRVRAETSDANSSYSFVRMLSIDTSTSNGGGGSGGSSRKSIISKQILGKQDNVKENKLTSEKEFEEESIKILDVSTNDFQLGEVAKIKIIIQNLQKNKIEKSYATLNIYNGELINFANLKSENYEIPGLSNKEIIIYWDTKNIDGGQYTSELKVNYNEKVLTENLKMDISKNSMVFTGAGFVISEDNDRKFNIKNLLIIVIAILILAIILWVLWRMQKRKKKVR